MLLKLSLDPDYKDSERNQFENLPIKPNEIFRSNIEYYFVANNENELEDELKTFVEAKPFFEKCFGCTFSSYLYFSKEESDKSFYLNKNHFLQFINLNISLEINGE